MRSLLVSKFLGHSPRSRFLLQTVAIEKQAKSALGPNSIFGVLAIRGVGVGGTYVAATREWIGYSPTSVSRKRRSFQLNSRLYDLKRNYLVHVVDEKNCSMVSGQWQYSYLSSWLCELDGTSVAIAENTFRPFVSFWYLYFPHSPQR